LADDGGQRTGRHDRRGELEDRLEDPDAVQGVAGGAVLVVEGERGVRSPAAAGRNRTSTLHDVAGAINWPVQESAATKKSPALAPPTCTAEIVNDARHRW
jgi:hypothetical protein